jgi:hypothetical protein
MLCRRRDCDGILMLSIKFVNARRVHQPSYLRIRFSRREYPCVEQVAGRSPEWPLRLATASKLWTLQQNGDELPGTRSRPAARFILVRFYGLTP